MDAAVADLAKITAEAAICNRRGHRRFQAARGLAIGCIMSHWRRPHVRVSSTASSACECRASAIPRTSRRAPSTARNYTLANASDHFSGTQYDAIDQVRGMESHHDLGRDNAQGLRC